MEIMEKHPTLTLAASAFLIGSVPVLAVVVAFRGETGARAAPEV